jgi:hypothetical protein
VARASTGETLLLVGGLVGVAYLAYLAFSGGGSGSGNGASVGAQVGAGIANEVNDAISSAAASVWNGTGQGPLDSWSNLANFLTGNCPNGNCAGS